LSCHAYIGLYLIAFSVKQVEEYSIRTHHIQMKEALEKQQPPFMAMKTPSWL
jgi:hypothetical protein